MKFALVTACPNGAVSSLISARLLEAAARRLGWMPQVEMPGGETVPAEALAAADWVLVVKTGPLDLARFAGKRLYLATPAEALHEPEAFLQRAEREAQVPAEQAAPAPAVASERPRLVAVTACPTGVAHTFMAAEALKQAAARLGMELQVETQGSVGARDPLPAAAIAAADVVLLATDIEVDTARFAGKRVYRCGTGVALKQADTTLRKALADAQVQQAGKPGSTQAEGQGEAKGVYKHLLTGVSDRKSVV